MAKSMRGRDIDMNAIAASNWHVRAVGNAQMNARGDKIDRQGNVVKQREQLDKELETYFRENPNAVRMATFSALDAEVYATPADVYKQQPNMIQTVEASIVPAAEKVVLPTKATKKVVNND